MGRIEDIIHLDISDYRRDTAGMSKSEHGSYLLSIFAYWMKGGALTHRELKEICGNDMDRVCGFYVKCDGKWHHKRIDMDLAKARKKRASAHAKAMKGVQRRRELGQLPGDGPEGA